MAHILVDCVVGGTLAYFCSQTKERDWYRYLLHVRPDVPEETIAEFTKKRTTDRGYFHRVVKADSLMWGWLPQAAQENADLLGVNTSGVRTLDAYAELVDTAVGRLAQSGVVGLKSAASTWRALYFGDDCGKLAEHALRSSPERLTRDHIVAFEDFVFRAIVDAAGRHGLPLQIHTGTSYGPGGRASTRAGAADLLTNLIQEFQGTQFVLMHASWPYWGEIEQIAKRFPNVYLDLCWAAMLSPQEVVRMLRSMFTVLPSGKFLWGGDCVYVEETYGAFNQARRAVSVALDGLVSDGDMNEDEAVALAVALFCTNGVELYGVG